MKPPAFSARHSSHTPTHTAAVARTTKVHFGMANNVTITAAPSDRPTAKAAGRLRPARETLTDSASVVTGATTALPSSGWARSPVRRSCGAQARASRGAVQTSRSSFSLPLSKASTVSTYFLVRPSRLLLAAHAVVLADLAVLDQPVEVGLGLAADVADRDARLLGLVVREA